MTGTSMTERQRITVGPAACCSALLAAAVAVTCLAGYAVAADGRATDDSVHLLDAREQGTFNIGSSRCALRREMGPDGHMALAIDYTAPLGTVVGVWSKSFPTGLRADGIDMVRASATAVNPEQFHQVALAVEIKGTTGIQRLPLRTGPEGCLFDAPVHWQSVGTISEVVFVASQTGSQPASGTIVFDIGFHRLSWSGRLSLWPSARIGGILLLSCFVAFAAALVGGVSSWWRPALSNVATSLARKEASAKAWLSGLKRDVVCGTSVVLIAGLAAGIYVLGELGLPGVGWFALAAAVAGGALAEWAKYGLTGKHLSPRETFQDMFATGLLAASASPLTVLQAPGAWSDLLLLSQTAAAVALVLYHAVNLYRLAACGRHLSTRGAAAVLAVPYLAGSLLLLESASLVHQLGAAVTAGLFGAWPGVIECLGRVAVVFALNEVLTNGLSLATRGGLVRCWRAHGSLLAVAAAAVAGPWIAQLGSAGAVVAWPPAAQRIAALLATMASQGGLWAEVYLITGMVMDAIHGRSPGLASLCGVPLQGMKKGMVYSGVFMAILHGLDLLCKSPAADWLFQHFPLPIAALAGAFLFPLATTIIATFDGSQAFFRRARASYRQPALYARGALIGLGVGYAILQLLTASETAIRAEFGAAVGIAAFGGVSLFRDGFYALARHGRLQWRVYLVEAVFGGLIGAAIGFYLDTAQISLVVAKFHRYLSVGQTPQPYGVYPFLSKWGFINLGNVAGGTSLLFAEALAGVISWSIPAWLFAINRSFLTAYFRREAAPIKALFTGRGLVDLSQNMLEVLRWGLWMSPIINSFLRPVGEPTWYNQDGAIHTVVAIFHRATTSPEAFRAWSLNVFICLLAYDAVRLLIWLDHMGLRVATLVNLSFLGMDRLDERLARFLGSAATARCIPEGVKRFATWAPLLIPYYLPMGRDWDYAWSRSEALQRSAEGGGLVAAISAFGSVGRLLVPVGAMLACTAVFSLVRWHRGRWADRPAWSLGNAKYILTLGRGGELVGQVIDKGYTISRPSYDFLDPAGRALFLVDTARHPMDPARSRPLIGTWDPSSFGPAGVEFREDALVIRDVADGLGTTLEISLAGTGDAAELWTVTVENLTGAQRQVKLVPYLEWVLNRPAADREHTQYNRLFAEMEYVQALHVLLAWDKNSMAAGVLAADIAPEGFLSSRLDFIGRAGSIRTPRVLETLAFSAARDTASHPTFDPVGSLLLGATLQAGQSLRTRILVGAAENKGQALDLVRRYLGPAGPAALVATRQPDSLRAIRHGEVLPGTPQPYWSFPDRGRTLLVHTPLTPRPFDHTLSNALGHVVVVTNRGLHTSASGNSQQNRITPDWPDIVTRELPGEALYLYDPDDRQWYSPTYHPLNDSRADYQVEFSVEGFATYHMSRGSIATELTVFVPPHEPLGIYLLTVRNRGAAARRMRLGPYFQMVLASQPEYAGALRVRHHRPLGALFFENPRNAYRSGPAFVAMSAPVECVETQRGRFFGRCRDVAHPAFVEHGQSDASPTEDARPVAGLLTTIEVPAHGECSVVVVLGQADDRQQAEALVRKYRDVAVAQASLAETRTWWRSLMDTVRVETSNPAFDRYLDWLKYQTLCERIWARRGFYQASGAYGFRDQLQDAVNLMWMEPRLARRQLLLHATQQFFEGDVLHWFHLLQDGRTGFAARTHASDTLLWLPWGVAQYVAATGDDSILDEQTSYVLADQPMQPLPAGKDGIGFFPHRSSRTDSIYRHCMKAISLVLTKRMGAHGLPLIGTGDWNDGLDEIGSRGKGESVWLGFFLYAILQQMAGIIERQGGPADAAFYADRARRLKDAVELTWRGDRYLRAIHDDGTEIGVKGSGLWEVDALTAAWAVMSGMNAQRGRIALDTALAMLERKNTILLGWPALREDSQPYLGRGSRYPAGVRENGMYCHGVQWLIGAARRVAEQWEREGEPAKARPYREAAYRLWLKISPLPHTTPEEIETYGGQPNKQAADMLTTFDPGRMMWNGYTGAAGWLFRQALEGVLGARLEGNQLILPHDLARPDDDLTLFRIQRELLPQGGCHATHFQ
jgi:cyclic beta-1,2-glucan synthetase